MILRSVSKALAVALISVSVTVSAGHVSTVVQDGSENAVEVDQTGSTASAMSTMVYTQGDTNSISVEQTWSGGSQVAIDQVDSDGNQVTVIQRFFPFPIDNFNDVDISQNNTDNAIVDVNQENGFLNRSNVDQDSSDYAFVDIDQTGSDHEVNLSQSSAFNTTLVDQSGSSQRATISQSGAGLDDFTRNIVDIRQDGAGNEAIATQTGGYANLIDIVQDQ